MRKLLLLLLIIPLFSYSQSNDFLTKLFLDSVQIQSQDFKIELAGVINNKAQQTHVNNTQRTITEILFLKDIKVAQQFKSEVYIGSRDASNRQEFKEKCTWNLIKSNCKFQKMTDKLGYTVKKGVNKITKPLKPITNTVKTKTKK